MIDIIEKYLEKIINETLTHTEVRIIAESIERATSNNELIFLVRPLKDYGKNHHQRKVIAKLMLKTIKEIKAKEKQEKELLRLHPEIDF